MGKLKKTEGVFYISWVFLFGVMIDLIDPDLDNIPGFVLSCGLETCSIPWAPRLIGNIMEYG